MRDYGRKPEPAQRGKAPTNGEARPGAGINKRDDDRERRCVRIVINIYTMATRPRLLSLSVSRAIRFWAGRK